MMERCEIVLKHPVPDKFYADFYSKIYYLSEHIHSFEFNQEGKEINAVNVEFDSNKISYDQIDKKMNLLIEKEFKKRVAVPGKRMWSGDGSCSYVDDMFLQLEKENEAFVMGDGLVACGEKFISLFYFFDNEIRKITKEKFHAIEYQYPTLLPYSVLEKCNYMNSFPHFLMFVSRLHGDYDVYTAAQSGDITYNDYIKNSKALGHCLPPTMCYHTYHQHENKILPLEGTVITSRGKSFRFESKYQKNLERLWDFTIREIVFIGDNEFVKQKNFTIFAHEIFLLLEEIGLTGFCETSNDPFFTDEASDNRRISQKLSASKYELRLNISKEKTIATGSFNYHNEYFGKPFNITLTNGETAKTSCAGFGLERLTYAFLSQFGLDEKNWPSYVRDQWRDL